MYLLVQGGSLISLPKDMDQAAKMLNMRIKIDVWSQGLVEPVRQDIREKLRDLFCQLPARRVWIYLKHLRYMLLKGKKPDRRVGAQGFSDREMAGAEDDIAKGNYNFSFCHTI